MDSAELIEFPTTARTPFEAARLTVRLDAILANYRECRRLAGPAAVAGVVKADAYGLGAEQVTAALSGIGCDTFFVARLEEGVRLRPLAPTARIFVLDGAPADAIPALLRYGLTPVLNSLAEVADWQQAARSARKPLDCAIHFDTGMNRLGLPADELALLSSESKKRLEDLRVVLWMSHLACASEANSKMNRVQLSRFRTALAMLPSAPASLSSSGGIMLGKDYAFDMVRPGIGLYGGNPQPERPNPFATVAQLTGKILQLRRVDSGETVGYGASFRVDRPMTLATIALGYADGLMRVLSNRGKAAIGGVRVPIVGRVSMDLLTLDVSRVSSGLQTGADVEFLGDTISLEELAQDANTASYEILTSLSSRAAHHYTGGTARQ